MTDENNSTSFNRTRRNIIAAAGVLAGVTFGRVIKAAKAGGGGSGSTGPVCFLKGTRVLTSDGPRRIEDIEIGDAVITLTGEKRVEWIGRRLERRPPGHAWPQSVRPVRIAKSALKPNIPESDLWLSQKHSLFIDGVLIRTGDLVNGSSIAIAPCNEIEEIEYLHVKVSGHDVIFAEGVPCETLSMNAACPELFDNFGEYELLYGSADLNGVLCAPLFAFSEWGARARVKSHLRSALSPWIDRRTKFDKVRDRFQEDRGSLVA
jgi:hypothetical protein